MEGVENRFAIIILFEKNWASVDNEPMKTAMADGGESVKKMTAWSRVKWTGSEQSSLPGGGR